jgi:hypothetical protein
MTSIAPTESVSRDARPIDQRHPRLMAEACVTHGGYAVHLMVIVSAVRECVTNT